MAKLIGSLVALLGIALGLAACGRAAAQPETAPVRPSAQYSWLEAPACRPPCWEGITPGVTTMTATTQLLAANPTIQHDPASALAALDPSGGDDEIRWGWIPASDRGGYAQSRDSSLVVDDIGLLLDAPVAFAAVRERLGPPSHALVTAIPDPHSNAVTWNLELIYLERGMILGAHSPAPPTLATAQISQVLLTHPDEAYFRSVLLYDTLFPWQEGAGLAAYCDEATNGERCLLLR